MLSYQDIQVDSRPSVVCLNKNQSTQRKLQYSLTTRDIKTHCIQDPFKLLATVMSQKPGLIFIDTDIQAINGYELCRLLRTSSTTKNIPVILLTEQRGIVERIQGKLAKASGYLEKPFFPQELLKVVDGHLVNVPV